MKQRTPSSEWLIDALALQIGTQGTTTLVHQLYSALRRWIQHGELAAGSHLPSSRHLAHGRYQP